MGQYGSDKQGEQGRKKTFVDQLFPPPASLLPLPPLPASTDKFLNRTVLTGGVNIKRRGVEMTGIALKCRVKIMKVREDFAEPKQLKLFETPNQPELIGSRQLRRHRTTRKGSKHGVPGNPPTQLSLWDIADLA